MIATCRNSSNCSKLSILKKELDLKIKQIKELEAQNSLIKAELAQVRTILFGRKTKLKKDKEKALAKKKGAPKGHRGWFRQVPKNIDKEIELHPKICPACGSSNIKEYKNRQEAHIQEDITVPQVEVTKYIRHYGYCKDCHRLFIPKGDDEILRSYIGPNAKAFAVYLKYKIKLSDRDIVDLFCRMFNLALDPSSIGGFRNQLSRAGLPLYKKLLENLKILPYVNADETGWKLDGVNHWLWKFANNKVSVTHIDRSRGAKVVETILGKKYDGILISDFLSAYNLVCTKAKQKCIVHLKRELASLSERYFSDKSILRYIERLNELLNYATELKQNYMEGKLCEKDYILERDNLAGQLIDFSFPNPLKGSLLTLAKRIERHKDNLFTFLYYRNIPYHNNHAEQQIRPDVLFRKITFGNRSPKGILNHSIAQSIIQTARLNGIDCYKILKEVLLGKTSQEERLLSLIRSP